MTAPELRHVTAAGGVGRGLDPDVVAHLDWCRDVRGLTPATVRARASVLGLLSRVVGRPLREATREDLLRWELVAMTRKPQTRAAYASHTATFFAWLVETAAITENPADVLTRPKITKARQARPVRQEGPDDATVRLLDRWEIAMRAEGNAARTITARRSTIELAARRTGEQPAQFTAAALTEFLAGLPSAGTRSTYWGALRAWFVWLVDVEELRPDNPMRKLRRPREPRRRPRPVTDEQLRRLLASGVRQRTRTWILLAAFQGLRVHEIAKIRGEDIDLEAGLLRVVGKGGVDVDLPLHPAVAAEAALYPLAGWWFPSYEAYGRDGEPVLPATVSITISRAMTRAGVPCTAHQLRHWFGTNTLRAAGGNVRVAQDLLRHASIATTALYTQVDDSERRAALLTLSLGGAR